MVLLVIVWPSQVVQKYFLSVILLVLASSNNVEEFFEAHFLEGRILRKTLEK